MRTHLQVSLPLALCLLASSPITASDAVMRTQSWRNTDGDFATCNERIASMRGRNLLARDGAKIVDKAGLGYGKAKMLFDGTAGVRVGNGRVGANGKPAVLTFYLGGPKMISQIGVFTFNSDARANQDFEVRFVLNAKNPGKKPTFPEEPDLTTGDKILGKNTGGFHTYFRSAGNEGLTPNKADWIQFRIWPTYSAKAGTAGKAATGANSWTSLVELEVLGDTDDVIWIPDDDFAARDTQIDRQLLAVYRKEATWCKTMSTVCEALDQALLSGSGQGGFRPFLSGPLTGAEDPTKISVDLTDLKRIWLETGGPAQGKGGPALIVGDPIILNAAGDGTPLTDLRPLVQPGAKGMAGTDKAAGAKALKLGERTFERGLWATGASRFCYALEDGQTRLEAWVGLQGRAAASAGRRFRALSLPSAEGVNDIVWQRVEREFRDAESRCEMAWEKEDRIWEKPWPIGDRRELARRYAAASHRHAGLQKSARDLAAAVESDAQLGEVRALYHRSRRLQEALAKSGNVSWDALRLAVKDLCKTFGDRYPAGPEALARMDRIEKAMAEATEAKSVVSAEDVARLEELAMQAGELQRTALLANPLLDFEQLLLVRRKSNRLGLPANWQSNSNLPKTGYDGGIATLAIGALDEPLKTVYRPEKGEYVGHVDLHFDAKRMLFSMPSQEGKGPWHVYEISTDGTGLRQVTQGMDACANNYDACYLPDDRIVFTSTAGMVAVPCVRGNALVATLFRVNADGTGMRQLCFDQEHSWHPAMMHDGRVLYTRWEYADLPHSNSRILFTANPDGTNQRSYYGSNSFWPNSMFYARPIPGHPTKVVATVTGHHAPARMGELVIFDPALGTREADGVVQRIPGYGQKVEPLIQDGLTRNSWPKFLHPYPLSENYFLVAAKPTSRSLWGIYLVDVFDNMVLLKEESGYALVEPVPLRPTPRPPVVPDRVDLQRRDAIVMISDIYSGPGLAGIPRGEVKRLRLYTYTFGYPGVGGLYGAIGMDGPWDMRRVLGTVPVAPDGSAVFRVPANTPLTLQPLDSEGKAMQIMRSWFTAMPGETLSCAGCHEDIAEAPPPQPGVATRGKPSDIEPWYGPPRNYEFERELQPVLDRHCIRCHDGGEKATAKKLPDLRGTEMITGWSTRMAGNTGKGTGGKFSVAYGTLHRFVRRPGIESPMPLQTPMEFHADTTELVQMLRKGHHGVKLDAEAWDRIITWIDFNAPYHGRWSTIVGEKAKEKEEERARLRLLYANVDEDHEALSEPAAEETEVATAVPVSMRQPADASPVTIPGWPLAVADATQRQLDAAARCEQAPGAAGETPVARVLDLSDGVSMTFVYIPPGRFVMGSHTGYPDEAPATAVTVSEGFWMGRCEITNAQFRAFRPTHDSGEEDRHGYQFGIPGYDVDQPDMPAVRLSWLEAKAFCKWLTTRSGWHVDLPTEAQWEWACRAGTDQPFFYGGVDADFSEFANLGDATLADFSGNPYQIDRVKARYGNADNPYDNWIPQDARFNDKGFVSEQTAKYKPNAWALHDMHGNVAEWTSSPYVPYPYTAAAEATGKRVVRGGSWYDRPKRCTASFRGCYREYQKVFNVGFRVVIQGRAAPEVGSVLRGQAEQLARRAD